MFKKVIPVLIALVLIAIIGGLTIGKELMEKYSYSTERRDLNEYFGIEGEGDVPIILNNVRITEKAKLIDGNYYFDLDTVNAYFCDHFYINDAEATLRYVLPDRILETALGVNSYTDGDTSVACDCAPFIQENGVYYLAVDFVRLFSVFDYTCYTEPDRMVVFNAYEQQNVVTVQKDTQVRYQGGIKSDILTDVTEGQTLTLLEAMDDWSKVQTEDGFIGYVENKRISTASVTVPTFQDSASKYGDAEFTSLAMDGKVCLGWHQIGGTAGNDTYSELNLGGINVISPTWFHLTGNSGDIVSYASQNYVDAMHGMGIQVWALVDNFSEEVDDMAIFSSSAARANLITQLITQVTTYGIDGINVDFERIQEAEGTHFVEFIRELSVACRNNGIILSVDNYVPQGGSYFYNRKEQGRYADYVIVMGYDEFWGGSPVAGSVASIDFVENGIRLTAEEVPSRKIINALPFYTRIWKTEDGTVTSEAVSMPVAEQFLANHNMTAQWDETTCQNYAEQTEGTVTYQVWMEDEASIQVKLNIMSKYHLGGVAAWKLGLEKKSIWGTISAYVNAVDPE
ncbi:MAG: chitinase [Lachnospiraceae bacterium]|nr:chitinase [Lachnospiraceae bacterium]